MGCPSHLVTPWVGRAPIDVQAGMPVITGPQMRGTGGNLIGLRKVNKTVATRQIWKRNFSGSGAWCLGMLGAVVS